LRHSFRFPWRKLPESNETNVRTGGELRPAEIENVFSAAQQAFGMGLCADAPFTLGVHDPYAHMDARGRPLS
jgi:hypothetical protein